jgi:hypothetical protein
MRPSASALLGSFNSAGIDVTDVHDLDPIRMQLKRAEVILGNPATADESKA